MRKLSGRETLVFLIILATAAFFRFYQPSTQWKVTGATLGLLTVAGFYFLTRELYDWRMAGLAGFVMAISFWPVAFSRSGFADILIPFAMVWEFAFFWRGLKRGSMIDYLWAGLFASIGFYASSSYWVAPLVAFFLFINYWSYLKKDFGHEKYEHSRNRFLGGTALAALTAFFTALPLGWQFLIHPYQLPLWGALVPFLTQIRPWQHFLAGIGTTLAGFNFSAEPLLAWPLGIFFLIGFIKELWHWLRRKHGHLSPLHTFLFAWFFVMLIPGFVSPAAPDALLMVGALPMAMLFTARGIWWIFEALGGWYDVNYPLGQYHERKEVSPFAVWVLIVLLASLALFEYYQVFNIPAASMPTTNISNIH